MLRAPVRHRRYRAEAMVNLDDDIDSLLSLYEVSAPASMRSIGGLTWF